jgi:putative sigma-54 modulation protein
MKVEIVGKNGFAPSDANRDYIEKKLAKLDGLIADSENLTARVVCKVYKQYHKVEVTIPAKNIILRAEVEQPDVYAAVDGAIDKLVIQVKRYNDRVKDKMGRKGIRTEAMVEEALEPQRVVRGKSVDLEPMSRDEAIDQMELLGHDFFIYLDKETRKTNVIYVRNDGDYAVIETTSK